MNLKTQVPGQENAPIANASSLPDGVNGKPTAYQLTKFPTRSEQNMTGMIAGSQIHSKTTLLQRKIQNGASDDNVMQQKLNRTGLPDQLKNGIENLSGQSMDEVRVHYNSSKPSQLQALAYAQGNNIHLGPGQEKHLAHEAWHVVQQKQGRVKPTAQIKGARINDDKGLEKEADVMGQKSLSTSVQLMKTGGQVKNIPSNGPVQLYSQISNYTLNTLVEEVNSELKIEETSELATGLIMQFYKFLGPDDMGTNNFSEALNALTWFYKQMVEGGEHDLANLFIRNLQTKMASFQPPWSSSIDAQAMATLGRTLTTKITQYRAIQDTRAFLFAEKERWTDSRMDEQARDPLSENLRKGAGLMMNPLSRPFYLDTTNQGMFYGQDRTASRHYQRSGKHPIRDEELSSARAVSKAYRQNGLGNGVQAHLGLYPNVYLGAPDVVPDEVPEDRAGQGQAYDQSLQYRLQLVQEAAMQAQGLTFLRVSVQNEYPLLMVHIDLRAFLATYARNHELEIDFNDGSVKPFTLFLMNFYTGLVNKAARQFGINVDMAERASFGFTTPSIAETDESFRINLGLMIPAYATVNAHALRILSGTLTSLCQPGPLLQRDPASHQIPGIGNYYDPGKSKEEELNQIKDWLQLAFFTIEKRGKTAITNITRTGEALDFANVQAFNTFGLSRTPGEEVQSATTAFKNALVGLLQKLDADSGALSTSIDERATPLTYEAAAQLTSPVMPAGDLLDELGKILGMIQQQINILYVKIENPSKWLATISRSIATNLTADNPQLATFLDMANELIYYLALAQLENQRNLPVLDTGYGSDSDVEEEEPREREAGRKLIRGKKTITHNGMRALLVAVESLKKIIKGEATQNIPRVGSDVQGAYYEVPDAVDASPGLVQDADNPHMIIRDRNAIVTGQVNPLTETVVRELTDSHVPYWVVDVTSATQAQMKALVDAFRINPAVRLLYLASSGYKFEQGGEDRNPYGTVRVFSDKTDSDLLQDAMTFMQDHTKAEQPLPGLAHHVRRTQKEIGNVPRNENLIETRK